MRHGPARQRPPQVGAGLCRAAADATMLDAQRPFRPRLEGRQRHGHPDRRPRADPLWREIRPASPGVLSHMESVQVPGRRLALSPTVEGALRARLCARDEQALVELIELTTPWLLGLVQGMLDDADEAEDVLLETFRLVWDRIDPDGPSGLFPLVFRIARNRAIDRLRRRKRHQQLGSRWLAEADTVAPPHVGTHQGWQVHTQVRAALAALPEEQQAVIQLAFFHGLSQSEIAQRLALPLGTVKTRLRLAYGKLRTSLGSLRGWLE